MNLTQLFGHWFAFLRDNLVARRATLVTKSDTVNDPAGEGWIVVLTTAGIVRCLPAANPEGAYIDLTLDINQVLPIRVKRVYNSTTTAVGVYLIN